MSKVCQDISNNFSDIQEYLITEPSQVIDQFFKYQKHFFYDTCSILHHSNASSNSFIIDFLANQGAIIIITRTVLMELSSNNFEIDPIQIEYFRKINISGIPVLLFDEEIVLELIKESLTITVEDANQLLGFAVKEVSKFKTAINNIIRVMDPNLKIKILNLRPGSQNLYEPFFQFARSQKFEGDSLAEELILILVIVLTKIPFGQYILISDDLRIRNNVISVNQYIEKHHNLRAPMQLTTSRLVYEMHRKQILTDENEMIEILSASSNGNINVFCMGEEDIQLVKKSFTKEELLSKIISEPNFSVAY
ncbi:hypothetical protein SAMN05446037_104126 [Anaerovirgula multivorans]|uniref:PIN domain-containing protein n=1 Tax=Anaerovirgula multivorans TaxID=312168 RepID=A0A239K0W7_9FIRM|nr:transposase [Anaerovirgula multivorans]SNT11439.1 hypothetical protein SAMN05446037_104126 [Anaerovirgula multivorans]